MIALGHVLGLFASLWKGVLVSSMLAELIWGVSFVTPPLEAEGRSVNPLQWTKKGHYGYGTVGGWGRFHCVCHTSRALGDSCTCATDWKGYQKLWVLKDSGCLHYWNCQDKDSMWLHQWLGTELILLKPWMIRHLCVCKKLWVKYGAREKYCKAKGKLYAINVFGHCDRIKFSLSSIHHHYPLQMCPFLMTVEDKQQIHFLECSSPYGSNLKCTNENRSHVIWKVNEKEKPLFPEIVALSSWIGMKFMAAFLGVMGTT